jgi:hypothetical protein
VRASPFQPCAMTIRIPRRDDLRGAGGLPALVSDAYSGSPNREASGFLARWSERAATDFLRAALCRREVTMRP